MPGKTIPKQLAASKRQQFAAAESPSSSSRGSLTPTATTSGAANLDEDEDEDEDNESTPTKSKIAIRAPSMASRLPKTPTTPTSQSRKLLAGLELDMPQGAVADPTEHAEAVHMKMAELQAAGWRPEEELANVGAEDEDDDDYEGVDLISHSDEDDAAIRATENRLFRDPDMSMADQNSLARRLSLSDDGDDEVEWNGFDDNIGPSFTDSFLVEEPHLPSFMLKDDDEMDFAKEKKLTGESQRKVRFEDEVGGSDGSSDSDESAEDFPDIFTDFSLKPYYTRNHDDEIEEGSDAGSVWDFEGDEMNIDDDDDDDTASLGSTGSSSGYDTDEGETTDEEECQPIKRPTPPPAERPTSSNSTADPKAAKKHATRSKTAKKASPPAVHHAPKFGTFELDPRRNVLIVSGAGVTQKNKLYPAKIQTPHEKRFWHKLRESYKNSTASPRTSVQMGIEDDSDYEMDQSMFSPSGPFSPAGTLMTDEVIGPVEAFTPFTSIDASGTITEDNSMRSFSEEEEDGMDLLSPYINFDAHDDDEEDNSGDTSDAAVLGGRQRSNTVPNFASSAPGTPATPSFSRQDTGNSDFSGVGHLSRTPALVSSFRLNQEYAKELASYASDPSARFSRSEMNAMQAGRRKAANTPITPMRKKRGGSLSKIGNVSWSKGLNLDKEMFLSDSKKKPSQHTRRLSNGRGTGRMGKGSTFR
ncbi:hypothetical protein BDZ85DRAFT_257735 [Elsinoe ampelina]|uniref:Uncharacterized protein n=1 Tax=Elsinoe ampelina TaxID=302913 RepID=A0A6A6GIL0_9PEZI|nr:hypothetical protein BDZ85DRAFT_257735 [Elsinoe ampelina]